jgi:large subunit ribosomal protein L47
MSSNRLARPGVAAVPSFLAPSAYLPFPKGQQTCAFSTTLSNYQRKDRNKSRGVSALRRTGPKKPLSVSKEELPRPVLDPAKRSKVPVKDDHGLWQFFTKDKKPLVLAEIEAQHGMAQLLQKGYTADF